MRPPRSAVLRFAVLVALLALGLALVRWTPLGELLERERLAASLELLRTSPWAPWALLALYLVISIFGLPVSPAVFAGGAVFGAVWGTLWNFAGAMIGASAGFLLARALGRDLVAHVIGRRRIARAEELLARHGFWTLVRLRFVPVPFVIVNYGAALAGFSFGQFTLAAAIGMAPAVFVYTYFSDAVVSTAASDRAALAGRLVIALLLLLALSFVPTLIRRFRKD